MKRKKFYIPGLLGGLDVHQVTLDAFNVTSRREDRQDLLGYGTATFSVEQLKELRAKFDELISHYEPMVNKKK